MLIVRTPPPNRMKGSRLIQREGCRIRFAHFEIERSHPRVRRVGGHAVQQQPSEPTPSRHRSDSQVSDLRLVQQEKRNNVSENRLVATLPSPGPRSAILSHEKPYPIERQRRLERLPVPGVRK